MGDSSSSSQANQQTTTNNVDKRLVNNGGISLSSEGSSVSITSNSVDKDIVAAALDTVRASDATNGEGFGKLLNLADKVIIGAGNVISRQQDSIGKQQDGFMSAVQSLKNDERGSIDQKTIIVLGVSAAAVLVLMNQRKG